MTSSWLKHINSVFPDFSKIQLFLNVVTLLLSGLHSDTGCGSRKKWITDTACGLAWSFLELTLLRSLIHSCEHSSSPLQLPKRKNRIMKSVVLYWGSQNTLLPHSSSGGWHCLASPHHHLDGYHWFVLDQAYLVTPSPLKKCWTLSTCFSSACWLFW